MADPRLFCKWGGGGGTTVEVAGESAPSKGRRQNSRQSDDKNMLGNIGDLFVKCMRQVTKDHLYNLLGVSDYYVMYRHRAQSVL